MDSESLKESAKATQEIAKTTKKGLVVAEKVGGFLALHIGGSLEQGMGLFEDKLKYYRAANQLKFISNFNKLASDLHFEGSLRPVSLKFALPLFEAVSLEDDDYLQGLWVNLLLNASDEKSEYNIQRSHVSILEQLTSIEARVLETIYGVDISKSEKNAVVTCGLPEKAEVISERAINNSEIHPENPNDEIMFALANLARLRLVALPLTFGGGEIYYYVNHTLLGQKFIATCTVSL